MRRSVKLFTVMLLVLVMVVSAITANAAFVPSIGYKDHPDVVGPAVLIDPAGEVIATVPDDCLVITPISKIEDEELKKVYEDLANGTTKLPYDKDSDDMVIRDLIYIEVTCPDLKEQLEKDDVFLKITLDLDVEPGTEVVVMVLHEGEWVPVKVTVDEDGNVTLVLDEAGFVAISVPVADDPVKTGDDTDRQLMIWGGVCALSIAAVIALVVFDMKKRHSN